MSAMQTWARWWFRTPNGRGYRRRQSDAIMAAAGLGVVVLCGALVAGQVISAANVAVFRWTNHCPGWLYPPMWVVQLSGGDRNSSASRHPGRAVPQVPPGRGIACRDRLKVLLEGVAKNFVQRGRPAETVSDVILRGKAAAHGLSFPPDMR